MFQYLLTFLIMLIAIPVFIVSAIVMILTTFLIPKIMHATARVTTIILSLFVGVVVKRKGVFPEGGPFIIMANHSSFIDPILVPQVIRGKFTGVVADYNYRYPVWAQILRRYKAICINRQDRKNAIDGLRQAEHVIKTEGYHVVILPEGTRTLTGKMNPLKKGGFHMAVNTKTSILPIGINGAYRFKPKNRFVFRPGKVTITVGEPILAEDFDSLGFDGLMQKVEKQLKMLSGEIQAP